jgi:hypothetical protein
VNGEVIPKIIRESFPELPKGLVKTDEAGSLGSRGYSGLKSDAGIKDDIERMNVALQANDCLTYAEHWMHASTRFNRQGYSIESPHNSIHMACGFPMTSIKYAAFHPIFFLHHCNVDRLYEKHVSMESQQECEKEFSARQRSLAARGEKNRYTQDLDPFQHPFEKRALVPADTFDTRGLGYVYDALQADPKMMMREAPVFCAFQKVEIIPLKRKSYMMHVFVMSKTEQGSWAPTRSFLQEPALWRADKFYAGCGAIFGGKAGECMNCMDRQPFNVLIEVQQTLTRLKLSRHEAGIRVLCEDEEGNVCSLEETPSPQPKLVGPMFEDVQAPLAVSSANSEGEVAQLQAALSFFGYQPGALDGKFGPKTEAAVRGFQTFANLKVDGIAGPVTKSQILKQRKDLHADPEPETQKMSGQKARFTVGSIVRFSLGPVPGYLDVEKLLTEINDAFSQWGAAMGVTFVLSGSAIRSSIHLCFEDLSFKGEALAGGVAAPGGQLAEATPHQLILDAAERWLLKGQDVPQRHPKAVRLYPVLVHEIGHCLGLSHSSNPSDVMWPYYDSTQQDARLSDNDKARIRRKVRTATPPPAAQEIPQEKAAAIIGHLRAACPSGKMKVVNFWNFMGKVDPVFRADQCEQIMQNFLLPEGDVDAEGFFKWIFKIK